LDSKNFGIGAKSDPYFELLVPHPSKPGETLTMYRSEHIHDTLEPCWKQFALNVIDVGGLDTPFSIRVFDFEKDGAHQEIGRVEGITLREWTFGPHRHRLKNPDAIRANASCGAFCIDDVQPLAGEVVRAPAPAYIVKPSAAKLERMDDLGTGKSDPFFRIIATPTGFTQPVTVYRSEVIASNLNPSWRPFTLNLCDIGGIDAPIHIMVYDYDSNGPELIGEARTTLRNWTFGPYSTKLTNPDTIRAKKSRGAFSAEITPTDYDPLAKVAPAFHFSVAGQKLDNHDGPGNVSDPFFEIILQRPGQGMPITYYRSETIRDSLNPTWKDFVVNTREIGGFDAPFELLVWDEDRDGAHDLIGRTTLTLRELSFGPYVESLINPERTSRIGYRSSGGFAFNKVVPLAAEQIKVIPSAFALDTSGIKLDVKDANLKSDPYWVLMRVWPPNSGNWVTVYRSDVVQKNTSPSWKPMSISADHVGGVDTPFAIRVYDWNADGLSDFIGEVSGITLRDFSHGNRLVMPILNPAKAAMLRYRSSGGFVFEPKPIDAAKVPIVPENISVEFTGSDLDFKDLNLKSDSFIEVKARTATPKGDKWFTIHRSPVQPKTRNPKWPAFGISAALVGGIDSIFKILVWDFDSDGGCVNC
jgi:Ca2+-dependent lipid-binding protein